VTKDVPAREIWRGFPARKIGDVDENELLDFEQLKNDCELCREMR
jgi:hypothetical protein